MSLLVEIMADTLDELTTLLDGVPDVIVTDDPRQAVSALPAGRTCVLVPTPRIEHPRASFWAVQFDIWAVTGKTTPAEGRAALGEILDRLEPVTDTARPDAFAVPDRSPAEGYVITTRTTTYERE